MDLPLTIIAASFLVPVVLFLAIGASYRRQVHSINHYFIFPASVDSRRLYSTFMASSLSMASFVLVFIEWGALGGLTALWSPIAWATGILVLWVALPAIVKFTSRYVTLHGFLQETYGTSRIRKYAAIATLIGFLGQFGVEVLVGATLFSAIDQDPILALFFGGALLGTIIAYSWLAGFLSVVRSDWLQYLLVRIGLIAVTVYVVTSISSVEDFFAHFNSNLEESTPPFDPIFDWGTVISLWCLNLPLLITDMSVWQRLACISNSFPDDDGAASPTPHTLDHQLQQAKDAVKSFGAGLLIMSLLVVILGMSFPIVPELANEEAGGTYITRLVNFAAQSPAVLFLLLVGVFCAILSTADTFLLAASQAYLTDVSQLKELQETDRFRHAADSPQWDSPAELRLLNKARSTNTMLALIAAAICFLLAYLRVDYISLLFVVFAGQASLWPSVVRGLFLAKSSDATPGKPEERCALASLFAGYAVVILCLTIGLLLLWFSEIDEFTVKNWAFYYSPIYVVVVSGLAYLLTPKRTA